MQAFCDFDGTISKQDVTDLVLERFALPEWTDIEQQWEAGEINSAECMRAQIRLLQAYRHEIDRFLGEVEIDAGFPEFRRFCLQNHIRLTIVSDGVDYFIRRVLSHHGITDIEVVANRMLEPSCGNPTVFDLDHPFASQNCVTGSGVCKCNVIRSGDADHIYIGDGRSDFCVSSHAAKLIFAKSKLAVHCQENRIPFIAYRDFTDITAALKTLKTKSLAIGAGAAVTTVPASKIA
ncbi:MtnX-like HAD-IB family phosphatase [Agrobacterium vitis]|uniref:Phosphoserine phosphatase n=2 Tax=Rhizobium/Agrobacterium group TaxID=227290 RepID=B9K183_ALLAM|nr:MULTISPECIES: MtnX-like HAD-IB family phosphatase [Rhizobium/Agrobacterium group]MCF1497214.1 HAD-IB family phosphatase [Allorhizobium sp. Av2]ACM38631.1 phosphoserine phosphatase [Allorhizobium ampelinum S4]MCF1445799.1 HAD-IB family phosphatase [Allorhizobium ampelinum]MCF1491209.1 HAD-IB family phosphatase [Allorhizobium ampelinum]MCM2439092.1 MtnX-like HAD-IB family phosphatase [Agrobacterium vitis]